MRLRPIQTACFLGLTGILGSCGGDTTADTKPAASAADAVAPRQLRDVLGSTLERLGVEAREGELSAAELRADTGLLPGEAAAAGESVAADEAAQDAGEPDVDQPVAGEPDAGGLDPDLVEMREGLIGWVRDSPDALPTAKKDIAGLKEEIAPVMAAGFAVEGRDPVELKALVDLSLESPSPDVAVGIATVAATHEEDWLRRYAAWALGSIATAEGTDRVVPLLLRRLKYERDPEALVWVSSTLAAFDNYAGTEGLYDTTARAAGDAAGDAARAQLAVVLQRAGETLGLPERPDTAAVIAAWNGGRLGRARSAASDGLLGEVWMLVADLSGEHFQLRGVDDARYTLSALGPWAAEEFALALEDDDEYVRLHTAQVLERMGPRGQGAFPSLVAGLHDPHDAVCGAAAEALVAVTRGTDSAPSARIALLDRIAAKCPYEIKVACVRALGNMDPDQVPVAELKTLFESTPLSDLRLAAAPGLLRGGAQALVLPWLVDELEASVGDPAGAEAVLGQWLKNAETDAARTSLEAWRAEAAPMSVVHTGAEARARRAARAMALRKALLPALQ